MEPENDTTCKNTNLIDFVTFINHLSLNPLIKSVEVIEEGSISVDFISQNILDSFSVNNDNKFIVGAYIFLLEEMIDDYESVPYHQIMAIENHFESLNLKQVLVVVSLDSDTATAYFITINEGVVSGFLAKMEGE